MAPDSLTGPELEPLDSNVVLVGATEPDYRVGSIGFRQLRYFVTVAEEAHFSRAAARLYITQPALSQAIARLEAALDVQLLVRNRHNVELTDAGVELLHRARRLLVDRDEAVERVRSVSRGDAGVLRLGVALLAEHEVAATLTALVESYPDIVLDRVAAVSERLIDHLREGALDAAFVHQVPALGSAEGVEWEVIRRARLAAVMAATNPLACRDTVELGELCDETVLVNPRELAPSAYEGMQLMCREIGRFEPKLLESPAASTLPHGSDWHLILDGSALAFMGETTARAICPEGVAAVPIMPPPPFQMALAWRSGDGSTLLSRFLEFARDFRDGSYVASLNGST
jgi:DNA-binding transcriptional LysR family regulator